MKMLPTIFATAALLASANAQAAFLTVVNVVAPDINCVFEATCRVVVNDSIGDLSFTPLGNGARLQTRTFKSAIGSPAAGKIAYLYRVDLTHADGFTDCLAGLVLDFGPVPKLPFSKNLLSHVYVITKGGIGMVGVKSAEQVGDIIQFNFTSYLCSGQSSFFFGLAAAKSPMSSTATLFGIGNPPIVTTAARVPTY